MTTGPIIAMVLASLVGLSLGALGGGGSILTIPLLVYVAGVPADRAIGMALVIVALTSFSGALLHLRNGNVALRPSLLFAVTGAAGAYVGSYGTHLVSRRSLMLLFAGIMLVVGARMWREADAPATCGAFSAFRCLSVGFALGVLTGFLGIGGGFMIVPALVLFAGLGAHKAAGTSLVVIALNSITGIIGQLRFVTLDWTLLLGFLAFAFAGMAVGATFANRLEEYRLRKVWAAVVLAIALAVGAGNLLS